MSLYDDPKTVDNQLSFYDIQVISDFIDIRLQDSDKGDYTLLLRALNKLDLMGHAFVDVEDDLYRAAEEED